MTSNLPESEINRPQFFVLDKSKPYSFVSMPKKNTKMRLILVFSIVYISLIFIFFGVQFEQVYKEYGAYIAAAFLLAIGLFFLVISILSESRYRKKMFRQKKLINNGELAEAWIEKYQYTVRNRTNGVFDYNSVIMTYTFYDRENSLRSATIKFEMYSTPDFYMGQRIMIIYTEDDSLILDKYTLVGENEYDRLSYNEYDFDGLDGTVLSVDLSKPVKSIEAHNAFIVAGIVTILAAAGFFLAIFLPLFSKFNILLIIALSSLPLIIIGVFGILILYAGAKKQKYFKKILLGNPMFTYAKVFASNEINISKRVIYCYIDIDGNRHFKELKSSLIKKNIGANPLIIPVMYDSDDNSELIYSCTFEDNSTYVYDYKYDF